MIIKKLYIHSMKFYAASKKNIVVSLMWESINANDKYNMAPHRNIYMFTYTETYIYKVYI